MIAEVPANHLALWLLDKFIMLRASGSMAWSSHGDLRAERNRLPLDHTPQDLSLPLGASSKASRMCCASFFPDDNPCVVYTLEIVMKITENICVQLKLLFTCLFSVYVFVDVCGCVWGSQGTTCRNQFSPSIIWGLDADGRLGGKPLQQLVSLLALYGVL